MVLLGLLRMVLDLCGVGLDRRFGCFGLIFVLIGVGLIGCLVVVWIAGMLLVLVYFCVLVWFWWCFGGGVGV